MEAEGEEKDGADLLREAERMTDHAAKQAAYARKRQKLTGTTTMDLRTYRVTLPDGGEVIERCIGLSQVAAEHPTATKVELVGEKTHANFW